MTPFTWKILKPQIHFSEAQDFYLGIHVRHTGVYKVDGAVKGLPSQGTNISHLSKGRSSTQIYLEWGYVSCQEGTLFPNLHGSVKMKGVTILLKTSHFSLKPWKLGGFRYPPRERVSETSPTKKGNFFCFSDSKVWQVGRGKPGTASHVTISKNRRFSSRFSLFFFETNLSKTMRFHRTANFLGSSFLEANLWSLKGIQSFFFLHLRSTQDASSWQIKVNTDSRS